MIPPFFILPVLATTITFFLGLLVLFNNPKNRINRSFSLFTFWAAFWVFSVFMADVSKDFNSALFWSRMSILGPTIFSPVLYYLSLIFPLEREKIKSRKIISIFFPVFIFLVLWPTPFNIKKVWFESWGTDFTPGPLYYLLILYIFFCFALAFINFLKSYKLASGIKRIQVLYVFFGFFSGVIIGLTTNAILPLFGYARLSSVGPTLSVVGLVTFISYAILKHYLMNIRVIATEILVFLASVVLITEAANSQSASGLIFRLVFLSVFIFIGILLIKSVVKEIKYREQIKAAYEVERHVHRELQGLDEAKNQFLMATQHHLRTPLTAMRGYLDLIFGGTYGKVSRELTEPLQKFWASTARLTKIVNELLDVSQFQLGKKVVSLEPNIQLEPILKEIIEELKFEAETKNIYLKTEKPKTLIPSIKADPEKLKVALFNVIDNAIKYTNKGGVTIKLQISDGKLQIVAQDTGMGISKEEIPTLFSRVFERTKEAQKTYTTGRGIGLYIAFRIIQAHHGKIWAESEGRGKGSTFYVELPVG